jgi:hypothetical protein
MLTALVYALCLVTSLACAALLIRSYGRSRTRLLLWTAGCFGLLALNNLFVVIDILVLPQVNLLPLRHLASLAAISVLIVGFIWEAD